MPPAVRLEACPLCRTTLRGGEERCPGCGAELKPYVDAAARSSELLGLARELLSRGEPERAAQLLPQIARIASVEPAAVHELEARIALARRDYSSARAALDRLDPAVAAGVRAELETAEAGQRRARELFNQALAEARQGRHAAASERLQQAVELDPLEPRVWELKLKCDLKARQLYRCYEDLAALDGLRARPLAFARLEALLPPALPAQG